SGVFVVVGRVTARGGGRGCGTTWHTAGLFYRLSSNEVDCMLHGSTMRICLSLEEETGVNPGWINNGSLFLTSRKEDQPRERQQSLEQMMSLSKVFGVESHLLNPAQIKDLHPLLNVNDLQSAVYTPTDGSMDPAGICLALTRAARWAGARVVEGCRVTDITTAETTLGGRKVTEVHTTRGVIKTNVVVNAAGGWSNDIANMVGLQVPLQIYRHGYLVTDSIPGFKVVPNVRNYSGSSYLKPQGEGFTVGVFEVNPVPIDKLSPDFSFGLYEPNWDIFGDMMQTAAIIMPALETVGVKSTIYGPESFTPDGKAIVGDDPNIEGFFHCCGFNSRGMQLSGGCGEQIAKWVVEGRPEIPMFIYDIRRFHPLLCSNRAWILARTHEKLLSHYNIIFPHDEPLAGRRQRCSPLHQVLEDAGAVYQEKQGWERPGWFGTSPAPVQEYDWYGAYGNPICRDLRYYNSLKGGYTFGFPKYHDLIPDYPSTLTDVQQIQRECLAAREGAAVFDMSSFGKYYLTGRDAQKVADWVFSADVTRALGTTTPGGEARCVSLYGECDDGASLYGEGDDGASLYGECDDGASLYGECDDGASLCGQCDDVASLCGECDDGASPCGECDDGASVCGECDDGASLCGECDDVASLCGECDDGASPCGECDDGASVCGQCDDGASLCGECEDGASPCGECDDGASVCGQCDDGASPCGECEDVASLCGECEDVASLCGDVMMVLLFVVSVMMVLLLLSVMMVLLFVVSVMMVLLFVVSVMMCFSLWCDVDGASLVCDDGASLCGECDDGASPCGECDDGASLCGQCDDGASLFVCDDGASLCGECDDGASLYGECDDGASLYGECDDGASLYGECDDGASLCGQCDDVASLCGECDDGASPCGECDDGASVCGECDDGASLCGECDDVASLCGECDDGASPCGECDDGASVCGQCDDGASLCGECEDGASPCGECDDGASVCGQCDDGASPCGECEDVASLCGECEDVASL
ncbi:Sarcosine dehydrogenase-like, partial [Homarus americanus]